MNNIYTGGRISDIKISQAKVEASEIHLFAVYNNGFSELLLTRALLVASEHTNLNLG